MEGWVVLFDYPDCNAWLPQYADATIVQRMRDVHRGCSNDAAGSYERLRSTPDFGADAGAPRANGTDLITADADPGRAADSAECFDRTGVASAQAGSEREFRTIGPAAIALGSFQSGKQSSGFGTGAHYCAELKADDHFAAANRIDPDASVLPESGLFDLVRRARL
jgi:hypothetical protein